MSTAKTNVGCLAEDFADELATICDNWLRSLPPGVVWPDDAQRHIDVAESFVSAIRIKNAIAVS